MTTRTTRDLQRLMTRQADRRAARSRWRSLQDIAPAEHAEQIARRHLAKLPKEPSDAQRADAWESTAEDLAELVDVLVDILDPADDQDHEQETDNA